MPRHDDPTGRLEIQAGKFRITVELPEELSALAMPDNNWLPFSAWELRIVRLLFDAGPLSREQIAARLDESPDGKLKGSLTTLVERLVVRITPEGYALNMPANEREKVGRWLESLTALAEA